MACSECKRRASYMAADPEMYRGEDTRCATHRNNSISRPSHYTYAGLECIDVIEALELNYHLGSAFAYIWRADKKGNPVEDLQKAIWYLKRDVERRLRHAPGGASMQKVSGNDVDEWVEYETPGVHGHKDKNREAGE